jgi:hypothetical protein
LISPKPYKDVKMAHEYYYVIMFDIIGSSKLKDRNALSTQLDAAIQQINKEYSHTYWAPFEITRGDEVAGVLESVAPAYDMIDTFSEGLYPVMFRSVIIFDKLDAGIPSKRSTVMDGPAFYRADQTMKQLKKTQKMCALRSGEAELDMAAEALINFLLWRWSDLTPLQRRIVRLYQREGNQSQVAEILDRTQQQIQNTLDVCKWEIIDEAEKAVRSLLQIIDHRNMDQHMNERST